jgi:hypothetical protein
MLRGGLLACILVVGVVEAAFAQDDQPPKIGPFVVDFRGSFPRFSADPLLAASRGLTANDLPTFGLGIDVGAHWYPIRWRAITLGIGGELLASRARRGADTSVIPPSPAVTRRFTSLSPQISLNFGSGNGWSYLSGGLNRSLMDITAAGAPSGAGEERLKTINYGGGARWVIRPHLAFSLDLRFYAINPGDGINGFPASPRMTLLVISAGIGVK